MTREMPKVAGVEHRYLELDGIRFHVAEAGPADSPPVLLVHGWPQHWYEWRHLIGPLAETHRVICPDLRGLGWSDAPERDYRKETMADDILGILDALEVERTHLAGHDWGAWIGFLLCLREPERFESFLALNILPPFIRTSPRAVIAQWRLAYQLVLGSPLGPRLLSRLAADTDGRTARRIGTPAWSSQERESFLGQFRELERARASMRYYRDFQLRELPAIAAGRYRRSRLRVPTLLMFGTDDQVMDPRLLDGVEAHGVDLRVELVPGVSHFIVDERPELVERRAREMFSP